MRIILDENLPRPLKRAFNQKHLVTTVQEEGMTSFENGVLIALLERTFDVFCHGRQKPAIPAGSYRADFGDC